MHHASDYDSVIRCIEASNLPRKLNKIEDVSNSRVKSVSMSLAEEPSHGEPLILIGGIAIDSCELGNVNWLLWGTTAHTQTTTGTSLSQEYVSLSATV